MKKLILASVLIMAVAPLANAKKVDLTGDAARSFIDRHFPDADIPGPVVGRFKYVNTKGQTKTGYANCFYPAMGEASNGVEPSCSVIY